MADLLRERTRNLSAATAIPRVAVVIPAWNEEGSIGRVIDGLPKAWVRADRVIVADNNSTDYTADVAKKFGATVRNPSDAQRHARSRVCATSP